jgi:glutamate racemase
MVSPGGPIGVFDSGVGGLSILKAIRQALPGEPLWYLADQAHVPYGLRSLEEVRRFSIEIARFLIEAGARMIVVACNTASAAALHELRRVFPGTPFVGMEPAVKPAAERTRSGVVGVLATPATFQGALYASVVERFARGVTVLQDTCPGLVGEIEAGRREGAQARRILAQALAPMLAAGVDTLVLGCTHYPFVMPVIAGIAGPQVRIIDPAPAVARQAARLLEREGLLSPPGTPAEVRFFTTAAPPRLAALLPDLWGAAAPVKALTWQGGRLGFTPDDPAIQMSQSSWIEAQDEHP